MQYDEEHTVRVDRRAAGVVLINRGRVLLVRENQGDKAGYWHIPSGSVAPGENLEDAARRELYEETGLAVDRLTYLDTYLGRFDDGEFVMRHVWLATRDDDCAPSPVYSREIAECRFFTEAAFDEAYRAGRIRMHHTRLMVKAGWALAG